MSQSTLPNPIAVVVQVTQVFEQLNIPYLIGGSFASMIYGMIRTTQDVDILAEIRFSDAEQFIKALVNDFYIDEKMIVDAIQYQSRFNIIHRSTMFKVDVFVASGSAFHKSELKRAIKEVISKDLNISAYFATAEDTILAKLEWFHLGGEISERQWRDILGILRIRANNIDLDYLRKWADRMSLRELLEKALVESA